MTPMLCAVAVAGTLASSPNAATTGPGGFDVPLYMWESDLNRDMALLAAPPHAFPQVVRPESYRQIFAKPVAFAAASASATAGVALRAFWSAERMDVQTTDWDLATLNRHGGNYTLLGVVGYLQALPTAGSWNSSIEQVPLQLSYSLGRTDGVTGPVNAEDVNALAVFSKAGGIFAGKQHVVGYGAVGSCPVCNTALAAAYPSLGGADCPVSCAAGTGSFATLYPVGLYDGNGADEFRASMLRAGRLLQGFADSNNGTVIKVESGHALHVSFNYFCCYDPTRVDVIRDVLNTTRWPPLNISFRAPVVRVDNTIVPGAKGDTSHHFSIIVLLDVASNARMEAWVADVERALQRRGVPVHLPRSKQQPFHSTLGVVNGLEYPSEAALKAINKAIPPGSWTANLTLGVPQF